jgi:hypothetical protein
MYYSAVRKKFFFRIINSHVRKYTRIVVFSETAKRVSTTKINRVTVQLKFFKRKVGIMGLRLGPGCGVSHRTTLKLTINGQYEDSIDSPHSPVHFCTPSTTSRPEQLVAWLVCWWFVPTSLSSYILHSCHTCIMGGGLGHGPCKFRTACNSDFKQRGAAVIPTPGNSSYNQLYTATRQRHA